MKEEKTIQVRYTDSEGHYKLVDVKEVEVEINGADMQTHHNGTWLWVKPHKENNNG